MIGEGGRSQTGAGGKLLWWGIEVSQKRPLWLEVSTSGRGGHGAGLNPDSANHQLVQGLARVLAAPPRWRVSAPVRDYCQAIAPLHEPALAARLLQHRRRDRRGRPQGVPDAGHGQPLPRHRAGDGAARRRADQRHPGDGHGPARHPPPAGHRRRRLPRATSSACWARDTPSRCCVSSPPSPPSPAGGRLYARHGAGPEARGPRGAHLHRRLHRLPLLPRARHRRPTACPPSSSARTTPRASTAPTSASRCANSIAASFACARFYFSIPLRRSDIGMGRGLTFFASPPLALSWKLR